MKIVFILLVLFQFGNSQFYCADLLQQCAKSAAEYTEQILQYKENAFKACVRRQSCHTERKIFDECFDASVSATHLVTPTSSTTDDGETGKVSSPPVSKYNTLLKFFTEKSFKFRSALDQCFVKSPFVPKRNFFGPSLLDEDAGYARAIYQFDLADKLWGLPEMTITRPSLDTVAVCGTRNTALRLFGSGISRISRSSDPTRNNLTSACMLDEDEITCYREALDLNSQYVQIVYNRDYALRSCVQNIREQSVCRMNDKSRLRSCLCGVREQYDNEMQSAILECVKSKSPQTPSMLIEMSSSIDSEPSTSKSFKSTQEQVEPSLLTFDTPGAVINGQCMCACDNSKRSTLFARQQQQPLQDETQTGRDDSGSMTVLKKDVNPPPKSDRGKFRENSPRLMQPSEAAGRVFWVNDNTTFV